MKSRGNEFILRAFRGKALNETGKAPIAGRVDAISPVTGFDKTPPLPLP